MHKYTHARTHAYTHTHGLIEGNSSVQTKILIAIIGIHGLFFCCYVVFHIDHERAHTKRFCISEEKESKKTNRIRNQIRIGTKRYQQMQNYHELAAWQRSHSFNLVPICGGDKQFVNTFVYSGTNV